MLEYFFNIKRILSNPQQRGQILYLYLTINIL
jgi:hypothetical protein